MRLTLAIFKNAMAILKENEIAANRGSVLMDNQPALIEVPNNKDQHTLLDSIKTSLDLATERRKCWLR